MHDERGWRQHVATVEVAGASEGEGRAQRSYYSAQQTDEGDWTASRSRTPGESEVGAVTIPITPGWDQRPGADPLRFDHLTGMTPRTLLGSFAKIREFVLEVMAPDNVRILPLRLLGGAIVAAFGIGWVCGSTWYSYRIAENLSRTVTSSHVSEKRAVSVTGNVGSVPARATPISRNGSTFQPETRKASLSVAQVGAAAPSTVLATAQRRTTSPGPGAPQGELKSEHRLISAPETSPETINGWAVRDVYSGTAVLVGPDRIWTARQGDYVPGVGRIDSITRWGSRWIVVTTSGLISTQ